MLYDGDCGFCRHWIEKWRRITGGRVRYAPYQEVLAAYPELTQKQCEESVQLVMADGTVFSGAHAVFKTLALAGKHYGVPLWFYEHVFPFDRVSERLYSFIARRRSSLSRLHKSSGCKA
jgi:predicted DCC family thiol-disulfide oxidoreductase YuxK